MDHRPYRTTVMVTMLLVVSMVPLAAADDTEQPSELTLQRIPRAIHFPDDPLQPHHIANPVR